MVDGVEKISSLQFFILVLMFLIGSAVLYLPTVLTAVAKQDAWIVAIIGGFLGVGVTFLYVKMAETLKGKNMVQIYESIFGTFIGKLLTINFIFYCLILSSLILRGIGDFMVTQILVDTPIEVTMSMFTFCIIFGLKYGIEVFARSAEIFFSWILILFILGLGLILQYMNIDHLFPIFEAGVKPILLGTFSYLGFPYLECVVLIMLVPYLKKFETVRKTWMWGAILGAIILFVTVLVCIVVFGADITSRQMYATYILAKKMGIQGVLERMEVIIAILWIFTIFYKLLISLFCLSKSLGYLFKLTDDKIVVFPLGMLLISTAIILGEDVVTLNDFSSNIWPFYAIQIGLVLPLLILIIDKLKKLKNQKR